MQINFTFGQVLAFTVVFVPACGGLISAPSVFRLIFALPYLFFLPGFYVLRLADRRPRPTIELLPLACGISMSLAIASGFLLHFIQALSPLGWSMLLGAETLGLCWLDQLRVGDHGAPTLTQSTLLTVPRRELALMAAAGLIAALAVGGARLGQFAHHPFLYTSLWLLPNDAPDSVTVGINNGEGQSATYDIEVLVNGKMFASIEDIALSDGQSWDTTIAIPTPANTVETATTLPAAASETRPLNVEAKVFRDGHHENVYRHVWLGSHASPTQPEPQVLSSDNAPPSANRFAPPLQPDAPQSSRINTNLRVENSATNTPYEPQPVNGNERLTNESAQPKVNK